MATAKKATKVTAKKSGKKLPAKVKKATQKKVAKHSTAAKKDIKKLVKKTVAKNVKVAKKAIKKHAPAKTQKKAVQRMEKQTDSLMKPFSDIATAVIDAVDQAMHAALNMTSKRK